jgi:uncharacterized protein DUF4410
MRQLKYVFALSIVLLPGVLPGATVGKVREKLTGYDRIEVAALRNKVGDVLDTKTLTELQDTIVKAINESKLMAGALDPSIEFPKKDPDNDMKLIFQGTGRDEDKTTLILFSEVITFNKGSRAKRYWVGGGTGRAEMRGNCYLLDKSTGEQLYYFQTFGETNWGAFGGGNDKALKGYANRIVNFIKGKY